MHISNGRICATAVTDLFGIGNDPADLRRTSLFEVPLLYRISLPQSDLREGEIDMMVENIFHIVEDHLSNFCDKSDLFYNCCRLFEEQYLLFEWNLIGYESQLPGISGNMAANAIREKVLSYMEPVHARRMRMEGAQARIEAAWRKFRENY